MNHEKLIEEDECLICLESCKINESVYCKICKKLCHKKCFKEWQNKKNTKENKCIYCQSKMCLKKKRYMFCCYLEVLL